ncbi:MAG: Uma2 family endonuclease [Pirellulales bacterium]|nr:Uma2 family endonuclease [Pirellulales bacterium]
MSAITHLTLEEYDRMICDGVFERRLNRYRAELIRGEIIEMAPIGSIHEEVVDRLNEWSILILRSKKVRVRVQNSIGLPELESAPEPDIVWVRKRDYSQGRPTSADVLLVIEVSESSLKFDCGIKAELYASTGIQDYWVVNLIDRRIEVRRDPQDGHYGGIKCFTDMQEVRPLAFPDIALRPAALWRD